MTTKAAWGQAEAAITESNKEATKSKAACDEALSKAASAVEHCGEAEANLKALQEEQVMGAQRLQQ